MPKERRPPKLPPEIRRKLNTLKGIESLTPEQNGLVAQNTRAWMGYWSRHPKEKAQHEVKAKERARRARFKRLAKHQPVVTDITPDGKWVHVMYTRYNGERVIGVFKFANGWDWAPNHIANEELIRADRYWAARVRAEGAARGTLPPEPEKTPRS